MPGSKRMVPSCSAGETVVFRCPGCGHEETAHPEHAVRCPHCHE